MSTRITNDEIIYINEVYAACHNYSQTAKIVNRAASTVRKYIIPDYKSEQNVEAVDIELPPLSEIADKLPPWYDITCLTPEEEREIKQLWKEMIV